MLLRLLRISKSIKPKSAATNVAAFRCFSSAPFCPRVFATRHYTTTPNGPSDPLSDSSKSSRTQASAGSDQDGEDSTNKKILTDIIGNEIGRYTDIEALEGEAKARDMAVILVNISPETYKLWPMDSPLLQPKEEIPPWGLPPKFLVWEDRFGRWEHRRWRPKQDKEIHIKCDDVDNVIQKQIEVLCSYIERRKRIKVIFHPANSPITDLPLENESRILASMLKMIPDATTESIGLQYYHKSINLKHCKYVRVFPKNQLQHMPKWV